MFSGRPFVPVLMKVISQEGLEGIHSNLAQTSSCTLEQELEIGTRYFSWSENWNNPVPSRIQTSPLNSRVCFSPVWLPQKTIQSTQTFSNIAFRWYQRRFTGPRIGSVTNRHILRSVFQGISCLKDLMIFLCVCLQKAWGVRGSRCLMSEAMMVTAPGMTGTTAAMKTTTGATLRSPSVWTACATRGSRGRTASRWGLARSVS